LRLGRYGGCFGWASIAAPAGAVLDGNSDIGSDIDSLFREELASPYGLSRHESANRSLARHIAASTARWTTGCYSARFGRETGLGVTQRSGEVLKYFPITDWKPSLLFPFKPQRGTSFTVLG